MKKILLAAIILSGLASCNSGASGDPKSVLVQFFTALSKNDMVTARKLSTKDSKSMLDMMEMGMKMGKDEKDANKMDITKMEFGPAKIDGDKAVIPVKELSTGETMNYTLKKEEGAWKVAFDKSSMMEMGMDKMKEKGMNPSEAMDSAMYKLKDINMDSLKDQMQKGMSTLDSARNELEKIKKP